MTKTTLIRQNPPRKRQQLTCPEKSITDPDSFRELSMASIKKKLERGLPVTHTNDAFYSLQPLKYSNLQDALDFNQRVTQQFESLPSELRKLMGNDIRNYETFITDPKNTDTLLKYGLAKKPDSTNREIVENLKDLKEKLVKSDDTSSTPSKRGSPSA